MEKVIIIHGKRKIELVPFKWRSIKRGEKVEYYQNKNKRIKWHFNHSKKGSCQIETSQELIEIELIDYKIEFIETRPHLELQKFQELFIPFISYPTWTKEKHNAYNSLRDYMNACHSDYINSSRDNKITKVRFVNGFTVFKVDPEQRGILMPFRNQYVLMYEYAKFKFQHFLEVYPLNEQITEDILESIAQNSKNYFKKS